MRPADSDDTGKRLALCLLVSVSDRRNVRHHREGEHQRKAGGVSNEAAGRRLNDVH